MSSPPPCTNCRPSAAGRQAFTLLEIMIVVGIMGIIMALGVPLVYRCWTKAPMGRAIADVVEACSHARAQAIMQGRQVDLVFFPRDGRFSVSGAAASASAGPDTGAAATGPVPMARSGHAGQFADSIAIEMLDINKLPHDFRLDDVAKVRFFPNGTCDELTLILLSERGERREILLEVTTGLASVESDPARFR